MKKLALEIDGRTVEGSVVSSKGVLWVHLDGETFVYEPPKRGRRGGKGAGAAANPGEIVAPMPGKIIKLLIGAGDNVSSGQVLLVMEAMKMEYTLKAQADGAVAGIHCEPNQQVTLGQVLVKLEVV